MTNAKGNPNHQNPNRRAGLLFGTILHGGTHNAARNWGSSFGFMKRIDQSEFVHCCQNTLALPRRTKSADKSDALQTLLGPLAGRIVTVPPSGGWKAARTRTLESVRYVAQPFQAAGWRSFPAPRRAPACGGPWCFQDAPRKNVRVNPGLIFASQGTI